MNDAWETLIRAGMPAGPARGGAADLGDPELLRTAVRTLVDSGGLETWQVAPLLAWLSGFRHHWPHRFREVLGDVGDTAIPALTRALDDRNRYLKLRRIAIANLSSGPSSRGEVGTHPAGSRSGIRDLTRETT